MPGWLYQTCPKCNKRAMKRILRSELKYSEPIDSSRTRWTRNGAMRLEEPFRVWQHSYEVERECRICGHHWVEYVVKQRPW